MAMAEMDRSKRYANPPKRPKKGAAPDKDESAAKAASDKVGAREKGPTDAHPGPVGKVGSDPGPEKGHDAEFGVVADRHKTELTAMHKRHTGEMTQMAERHQTEAGEMGKMHSKQMQDHFETAASGKLESSAGSPKELGKAKDEGKKGSEP